MHKIILSKEQENQIIQMYNSFIPVKDIVKDIGCNKQIIYKVLKNNNVDLHGERRVLTTDQQKDVINKYQDGLTQQEIADFYNINRWTVKNILQEHHIKLNYRGDKIRKYNIDEQYFDVIDTPEKAYIIGLLWADGCNKTDRGCITLCLQERDKHILESIKKEMKSEHPLYYREIKNVNHSNMYSLEISSRRLSNRLDELGMVANKSLVLKFPEWLSESLYSAFLLGLVDGDGNISKKNYSVSIVGTKYLLEYIEKILKNNGIECNIYCYNTNEITKTLMITKKQSAMKFLNWIYSSGSSLFLQRKYNLYLQKCINFNNSLSA